MKKVLLEIYTTPTQGYGLLINRVDSSGNGDGYRIFGPKLYGQSKPLKKALLSIDDINRLIDELKLSKEFLENKLENGNE